MPRIFAAIVLLGMLAACGQGEPQLIAGPPKPMTTPLPTWTPAPRLTVQPHQTPPPGTEPEATETPSPKQPVATLVVKEHLVDGASVRAGPGFQYANIETAYPSKAFVVTGRDRPGEWFRFEYSGVDYWIHVSAVDVEHLHLVPVLGETQNGSPASLPVPSPRRYLLGTVIQPKSSCPDYDRRDYSYSSSVKQKIVDSMGGRIYSPYTGEYFSSTDEAGIEHIVALREAHYSGLCNESSRLKRAFAQDLLNLTLASESVNQQKSHLNLAGWLPAMNQCWFVKRVVEVKQKYGLSMDAAEAQRALELLGECGSFDIYFFPIPG